MPAIIIDQREPEHIKQQFQDAAITLLETGDAWVACEDGNILLIERKTSNDLLNSLRDGRLMEQISRLVSPRIAQYYRGEKQTYWEYLVITGELRSDQKGKAWIGRETGWEWNSVQGALLTIQEMGCCIVFCSSDTEYEKTIMMLARRNRKVTVDIFPRRVPVPISAKEAFLMGMPDIGIERARKILEWTNNNLAHAIVGITDVLIDAPLGVAVRQKIRRFMNLDDNQTIELVLDEHNKEKLIVKEQQYV